MSRGAGGGGGLEVRVSPKLTGTGCAPGGGGVREVGGER